MSTPNPKNTKRKFKEKELPYGVDNDKFNVQTHRIINYLFGKLAKDNNRLKYQYANDFFMTYLVKEIELLEDKDLRASYLNNLKKVPKL